MDNVTTFGSATTGSTPTTLNLTQLKSANLNFAEITGQLSDARPSQTHTLRMGSGLFTLPSGSGLVKLTLEHESDQAVQLQGPPGFTRVGEGLLGPFTLRDTFNFQVTGRGAYRILVSLAGDIDGDGDVDGSDATASTPNGIALQVADLTGDGRLDANDASIAAQNLGVRTLVRPLVLQVGLDPAREPFAHLSETLNAAPSMLVKVLSGNLFGQNPPLISAVESTYTPVAEKVIPLFMPVAAPESPILALGESNLPLGENHVAYAARDEFGQRVESSALVERLDQPSEPPASLPVDKRNRIWLLDVHANNYLFRGPLPLTTLEETGQVDFPTLVHVMNQRLAQQGAPISTLPGEFKFTEIVLITNQATKSTSHGDEGFAVHQIYKSILGSDPAWPPDDPTMATSLFTGPLDNKVVEGATFTQMVDGNPYTIHPSVTWQPVAANPTNQAPTTVEGGANGYKTIIRSTFPIVFIAPNPGNPQRQLTNPLSNVSVATRYIHQLMQEDHTQDVPHIFYLHCVNGHDRTGMLATTYVLSAYGKNFNYDLATAYEYGQMGTFLPDALPNGIAPNRNFWDKLESDVEKTGRLKSKYMQAVRALAYLYYHPAGSKIQKAPALSATAPAVPLWQKGFTFGNSAESPIEETPSDYLKVRP